MPLERLPVNLQRHRELHVPRNADVVAHAYAVDVATLGFLAGSSELAVRMPQEPLDTPFMEWGNGRSALGQLLRHLNIP